MLIKYKIKIMKIRSLILTICAVSMAVSSCSLDLEYLNGPNASTFPASTKEVESGIFAAYKGLSLVTASSTPYIGIQDNLTDIGASRINKSYNYHQRSSVTFDDAYIKKMYQNIFKTAGRVNLVLDNIDVIKNQVSEQDFNSYKAELLLIRSYVYEMGCELFGDIPYIDHTLGLSEKYDRAPKDSIINLILDRDLNDELIEALPIRHDKLRYGYARIGRAAAYGLKARFYLNWGRFESAAIYADKAIELARQGGYRLEELDITKTGINHDEGEPNPTPLFGLAQSKQSDEWLWGLEYNTMIDGNTHNSEYYSAPRIIGGCSYFSPTQSFLDAIQCKDGKSIVESPLFDWQHPWENRDPRLDLFCVRPGSRVLGLQFETNPDIHDVINYNTADRIHVINSEAYGTKCEYGANGPKGPCGYLWRKYLDKEEFNYNNQSFGTKSVCVLGFPLMRLPELYLIRAEANIEMEGGDLSKAKSDIEFVRARVGMPKLESMDRESLRSNLRYERMVELCNEGFRWFDIRRWNIAQKVLNGVMYAPSLDGSLSNAIPTIDEDWHVTYSGATFDGKDRNLRKFIDMVYDIEKDNLWPIPEVELVANKHMQQNPGY